MRPRVPKRNKSSPPSLRQDQQDRNGQPAQAEAELANEAKIEDNPKARLRKLAEIMYEIYNECQW